MAVPAGHGRRRPVYVNSTAGETGMKVGVSIYSFNRLIKEGKADKDRAVALAGQMGLDGIEMLDMYWSRSRQDVPDADEARAYAKLIEDSGLELCCYTLHSNLGAEDPKELRSEIDRVKRHIDIGNLMGVSVMRIESCYGPSEPTDPTPYEARVVEATKEVAEHASGVNIRLGVENHGRLIATSRQMVSVIERVNSPFYGATIDIGNFVVVDEDSVDATRALAKHAFHVHAKDFKVRDADEVPGERWGRSVAGRYFQGCVVGEGDIPVRECLKVLIEAGYDGYLSIEYEGTEDSVEGVRRGAANLREMLAEL